MIHTKFTLISYMFSYIECVTHTHIHKIHLGYHKEKNVLTKKNKVKGYHQLNVVHNIKLRSQKHIRKQKKKVVAVRATE